MTVSWRRYLRFWRPDVDADVDDELRFHLDARIEDLVGGGAARDVAATQALAELGDLTTVRDRLRRIDRRVMRRHSRWEAWSSLASDVRYAIRRLRASPGFTIAAGVTLTIAIGATASVFGVVDGVLLEPFPYRDLDRVVILWEANPGQHIAWFPVSAADYVDWRDQNHSFTALAASTYGLQVTITGSQEPERVSAADVTPDYFSVLGLTPAAGRFLSRDSGGPSEAVISYGYWQRRFGGRRSALGQTITIDGEPRTVVGVTPAGLPGDEQVWQRLSFTGDIIARRASRSHEVYGRLRPGVTVEAARRDLELIAARLAATYHDADQGWTVHWVPFADSLIGDVRPALLALLAAAACVLLIGAANLANLFLVRCFARERELTVRAALGATRGRLVRELLAEAAILSLVAGTLGVCVAVGGVRLLRALAPSSMPRLDHVTVDARVVAFCAATSITTALVFGLAPAWYASRDTLAGALKEGARATSSALRHRVQDALVLMQVAVALVLLTGAGLLVESFEHFERMDPGFRPDGVVTAAIAPAAARYPTPERRDVFMATLIQRVAASPGVQLVSISSALPPQPMAQLGFTVVGDPTPDPAKTPYADLVCATPGYLRTMGLTLLRGRWLLPTDVRHGVQVVVIDDVLARQLFAGRDPVGKQLDFGDTVRIVGVVGTVKDRGLATTNPPQVYAPLDQCPSVPVYVEMRSAGPPDNDVRLLERASHDLDPTVPVYDVQTMSARVGESVGTTRFSTFLASLFAIVAMVLGVVGIYSVLAYVVSQRRRDIAVRLALGASHSHVIGAVLWRAAWLTGLGIASGSLAAWIVTRILTNLFLGVSPHDPVIFVGAAATFVVAALVAATVPAVRTTRVDLVDALTTT